MTFKPTDFISTPDDAMNLTVVDQLVEHGMSRERAERLYARLDKIIEGPWNDILQSVRQRPTTPGEADYETAFLQTCLVAYMHQWAKDRLFTCAATQAICLAKFAEFDAERKDTI